MRGDTANVVFGLLAALMAVTFGPAPVLRELLAGVPGVPEAWIYGSWAARYAEQPGPAPKDVDVLIVGAADPDVLAGPWSDRSVASGAHATMPTAPGWTLRT